MLILAFAYLWAGMALAFILKLKEV